MKQKKEENKNIKTEKLDEKEEKTKITKKEDTNETKEKKMNFKQKIALERIYRLVELAEKQKDKELAKRYLQLAKRIGEKVNVKIPKELKQKYCKKCFSLNIKTTKETTIIHTKCEECGYEKKYKFN